MSHDEHLITGIVKQYQALRDVDYELIVIGNTNVGKSTFLNNLTKMKQFFNTSVNRETANVWRFRIVDDTQQDTIFKMTEFEINPQSVTEDSMKTLKVFNEKESMKDPFETNDEEEIIKAIKSKATSHRHGAN